MHWEDKFMARRNFFTEFGVRRYLLCHLWFNPIQYVRTATYEHYHSIRNTIYCDKTNPNLRIKTEPVTAGECNGRHMFGFFTLVQEPPIYVQWQARLLCGWYLKIQSILCDSLCKRRYVYVQTSKNIYCISLRTFLWKMSTICLKNNIKPYILVQYVHTV